MADATAKAEETAALLNKTVLTIAHQAGDDGRLFGSVTSQDIADAIKEARGVDIDRRDIHLDEPIKSVGTRMVVVEVETGVTATVKTMVVEQQASRVRTAREASLTAASSGRRCFRPTLRVEHVFDSRPFLDSASHCPPLSARTPTATATHPAPRMPDGPVAPPQNLEAEQSVLGAVLLSDTALPALIIDERLHPDDFYREAHGLVFQAMLELHNGGEPVDALTLVEHLKQAGQLDAVGGRATIDLLAASVPAVGHLAPVRADRPRERDAPPAAAGAPTRSRRASHAHDAPPRELVDIAERTILEVAHEDSRKDFRAINDVLDVEISKLEELSREGKDVTGTPSGFADLDTYTGGFQPGNLIILAARPVDGEVGADGQLLRERRARRRAGRRAVLARDVGVRARAALHRLAGARSRATTCARAACPRRAGARSWRPRTGWRSRRCSSTTRPTSPCSTCARRRAGCSSSTRTGSA